MKLNLRTAVVVATLASVGASAAEAELDPEKVGRVQYQEKQAIERVQKEYGDRKPSELSQAERKELIQKQSEELRKVHEEAGIDEKDYARYSARMSADQRATAKAAEKAAEKEALKKEIKDDDEKAKGPQVVPYDDATMQEQSKRAPPDEPQSERKARSRPHRTPRTHP